MSPRALKVLLHIRTYEYTYASTPLRDVIKNERQMKRSDAHTKQMHPVWGILRIDIEQKGKSDHREEGKEIGTKFTSAMCKQRKEN
ncbi:hypothetical protein POVWA2_005160 [Plasmodium ovale wallikeri]|uniref:Uncharacterized protein n=1 Tax=Plasmodium ovale wallikeri TaxID=864142 RepID=A0A1A8YJC1_PLAOA|nr:hypothetical protein POVWA1_005050 [Plasmodium ovale wallikeri]SBT31630.1 hypothetical protein POVWA2_005160 [Plasmodium ovale wallikeri]